MSIPSTVRRLALQQFTVQPRTGIYSQGRYESDDADSFEAKGNVQPSTPADLKRLPEGSRIDGAITIWGAFRCDTGCRCELSNGGSPNTVPDRITWRGVVYEVSSIELWRQHERYICTRAQQ